MKKEKPNLKRTEKTKPKIRSGMKKSSLRLTDQTRA
jgi:hypothetical protein